MRCRRRVQRWEVVPWWAWALILISNSQPCSSTWIASAVRRQRTWNIKTVAVVADLTIKYTAVSQISVVRPWISSNLTNSSSKGTLHSTATSFRVRSAHQARHSHLATPSLITTRNRSASYNSSNSNRAPSRWRQIIRSSTIETCLPWANKRSCKITQAATTRITERVTWLMKTAAIRCASWHFQSIRRAVSPRVATLASVSWQQELQSHIPVRISSRSRPHTPPKQVDQAQDKRVPVAPIGRSPRARPSNSSNQIAVWINKRFLAAISKMDMDSNKPLYQPLPNN